MCKILVLLTEAVINDVSPTQLVLARVGTGHGSSIEHIWHREAYKGIDYTCCAYIHGA